MALVLADRVLETTSVAGTGDASLSGAIVGYQPSSVIGGGNTTYYTYDETRWPTTQGHSDRQKMETQLLPRRVHCQITG